MEGVSRSPSALSRRSAWPAGSLTQATAHFDVPKSIPTKGAGLANRAIVAVPGVAEDERFPPGASPIPPRRLDLNRVDRALGAGRHQAEKQLAPDRLVVSEADLKVAVLVTVVAPVLALEVAFDHRPIER